MVSFRVVVGDPSELRSLRQRFADWLRLADIDGGVLDGLVLAVREAAANGLQHGAPAESVSVSAELVDGVVAIEVADKGSWQEPRLDGPELDEGGRGLAIIQAVVNDVTIRTTRTGTTLGLRQRVV